MRPLDQRTFDHFETFWTLKMDLWHETHHNTKDSGYGGNATGTTEESEDPSYAKSLESYLPMVEEHNQALY